MPLLNFNSPRRWALSLTAALFAAFLSVLFINTPSVYAADATWDNGAISYNDKKFTGPQTANGNNAGLGLANGVKYYVDDSTPGKRAIVYFNASDDPANATQAQYAVYDYAPPDNYSNREGPNVISIDKQPDQAGQNPDGQKEETSCAVNGIGFVVCPAMNFFAESMDYAFKVLQSFLEVEPLSTDTKSSTYMVWSMMRTLANIGFIIALLVVIYSHITSFGVNNYDIKRMIPRLMIAAVLVNASYYISAAAVDVSNIVGHGLQQMFEGMRHTIAGGAIGDFKLFTWANVTGFILSGGTIGAGAVAGLGAMAAYGASAVFLLVPILMSALIAIIVAVVILAARQALITVLIVLSPIAFVAYVLPNTEKFFDRWRNLFQTMLLVFPMFSLLFGGAQLAAYVIAQNAQDIQTILFAMFIQVAPLIITPFLIKFSGSLLGRLAGIINNPAKGIKDRANNWAKDRRDEEKERRLQEPNRGWRTPGLKIAQGMDSRKRRRDGMRKYYQAMRENQFSESAMGQMLDEKNRMAEQDKSIIHSGHEAAWYHNQYTDPHKRIRALQAQAAEMEAGVNKKQMSAYFKEIGSERGLNIHHPADSADARQLAMRALGHQIHALDEREDILGYNESLAENVKKREFAEAMGYTGSDAERLATAAALQQAAGGIHQTGALKAQSQAMAEIINAGVEDVKAIKTASPVAAGDVDHAARMFQQAVDEGDVASMRAYADMLGEPSNTSMHRLRQLIRDNHDALTRMEPGALEVFKHHLNSNATINRSAEDIGAWSREATNIRSLSDMAADHTTWKVLSAAQFSSERASTQMLALGFEQNSSGDWERVRSSAISTKLLKQVKENDQLWKDVKENVQPKIEELLREADSGETHVPLR